MTYAQTRGRISLPLLLTLAMAWSCGGAMPSQGASRPWWTNYHTLLSHPRQKLDQAWRLGMMAERSLWATGWYGPWWIQHQLQDQHPGNVRTWLARGRKQGLKNVFYYDAGEYGEFVALIRDQHIVLNQWQLCFYRGEQGQLAWFGKNGFYRDDTLLSLKNYRGFDLPPWTLPNGARVESVYTLARTSIDGHLDTWDHSSVRPNDTINQQLGLDAFLRHGDDPVPESAGRSLGRIRSYDHSNPFLLRDFEAGLHMMLALRPAFIHFDNYFDNETLYPSQQAFGPWSVEQFKRRVSSELDAPTRQRIGIPDVAQFDLRQYIQDKPFRSRGKRWQLHNTQWQDDPLWNLFICSKWHDSDTLFRQIYQFCKEESGQHGTEVVVVGNANPLFPGRSLISGAIDIAHFEHHAATQFGPIVEPTGLPPRGRLGGVVRLGAAVSKAGYCWPTVYVPQPLSGPKHANLHKVLAMDCLANKGVLDYNYQYRNGYSPGCDASAAWADCFIKTFSEYYGARQACNDVAVVFPGQTQLASVTVFSMDPNVCLYDYLGWTQALTQLHIQWDAVPDDRIAVDTLSAYQAVVLPSAMCLSDPAIDAIVKYIDNGGRVVLSGTVGTRYGPEHYLWSRAPGDTLSQQLGDAAVSSRARHTRQSLIVRCTEPLGKTFFLDKTGGRRVAGSDEIADIMDIVVPAKRRIVQTDAACSIGTYAYRESDSALAVDLVNYELDVDSDELASAPPTAITVRPPAGYAFATTRVQLTDPDVRRAVAADASDHHATPWRYDSQTLAGTIADDGALVFTAPSFNVYCRASLPLVPTKKTHRRAEPAAHGATEATDTTNLPRVIAPPAAEVKRLGLSTFYRKYIAVKGFPIVGSEHVSDYALREAAYLVEHLLAHRADVRKALIDGRVRLVVMGYNEWTTDVPEHSHLQPKDYWDRRARGLGATPQAPTVSCAEENLLSYQGDPYFTENIMIHEFGHTIHLVGLHAADPSFDTRLQQAFKRARAAGLWDGTYAGLNRQEYWAEGVQTWFDTNRQNDSQHNHVNTRAELKEYDPALAKLLMEVFGDTPWRYSKVPTRTDEPHLAGYDPQRAPHFRWPDRLKNVKVDHPAADK